MAHLFDLVTLDLNEAYVLNARFRQHLFFYPFVAFYISLKV